MRRHSGVVLITALIVLTAITLLLLNMLDNSATESKMSNHYHRFQQLFQVAQAGLTAAEDLVQGGEAAQCQQPARHHNYYPQSDQSWWRQNVNCQIAYEDIISYHVIEDLGSLSCVHIAGSDEMEPAAVQYYRITANAQRSDGRSVILQSTMTRVVENLQDCGTESDLTVTVGRQSWREII